MVISQEYYLRMVLQRVVPDTPEIIYISPKLQGYES